MTKVKHLQFELGFSTQIDFFRWLNGILCLWLRHLFGKKKVASSAPQIVIQ